LIFPDITPELKAAMPQLRGRLLANQSLAELTWFRVGGPAQVLFTPADEDDLAYFLNTLPKELPVYVVGVGSNLIVRDGGMAGVVIRLSPRAFGETSASGDIVSAGTALVTIMNPPPGGGTSNALTFTINNLVPAVTAVMAYLLFDERLDTIAIIGMVACAAAVFLVNRRA